MLTLAQKMVAVGMVVVIVLAMFLMSPLLGVIALIGSLPFSAALFRL